jgi:Uma2 family endonuclease
MLAGKEDTSMSSARTREQLKAEYERYAQEYLRGLPLEHFMEATDQATQREITLESFALVKPHRPDLYVFNELLVQYPRRRRRRPGQVVPDNMIVLSEEPPRAQTSFATALEPAGPFCVMEYVSKSNKRKDYEDNFDKYEQELKVPYYLLFYPDGQELTLYRHNGKRYVAVQANEHGRFAIPELEIEVALLDGWVRYWFRGQLLLLPAEIQRQLGEVRERAEQERERAEQERERAEQERERAEQERERAEELQRRLAQAEQELAQLRAQPGKRNKKGLP